MLRILAAVVLASAVPVFAADAPWVDEARSVASSVPPQLLAMLTKQIKQWGPEGAIGACREQAPQMARAASEQTGWTIRRVSLRNRNPNAVPDAWEDAALRDFDRRAAAGEQPATLERAEVVNENNRPVLRYMRALPTQELCLSCHGAPERMSAAVLSQLKTLYPEDKAVGYSVGQIRGAITIKKPQ